MPITGQQIEEKAMKYCPVVLLVASTATCMSPSANACPEVRIDMGMHNPVEPNLMSVIDGISPVKDDVPLETHAIPPLVHGPTYYPAWQFVVPTGKGRFVHLRGDGFLLQERNNGN